VVVDVVEEVFVTVVSDKVVKLDELSKVFIISDDISVFINVVDKLDELLLVVVIVVVVVLVVFSIVGVVLVKSSLFLLLVTINAKAIDRPIETINKTLTITVRTIILKRLLSLGLFSRLLSSVLLSSLLSFSL
jgi:hypothetical protein